VFAEANIPIYPHEGSPVAERPLGRQRRLKAHLDRATWAGHLDYLHELLATYVVGSEEIVEALRGLERFTALEAEMSFDQFLEVVRRAIATLRSEKVLGTRAGAFAPAASTCWTPTRCPASTSPDSG
jgi:hypothetical protein